MSREELTRLFMIGCIMATLTGTQATAASSEPAIPTIRTKMADLPAEERYELALRSLLGVLSVNPDKIQKLHASDQVKESLKRLLSTETEFIQFVSSESMLQLKQLCSDRHADDAIYVARAVRSVDAFREEQRHARYGMAALRLDARGRAELQALLEAHQADGSRNQVDLLQLAQRQPGLVVANLRDFCARPAADTSRTLPPEADMIGNPSRTDIKR